MCVLSDGPLYPAEQKSSSSAAQPANRVPVGWFRFRFRQRGMATVAIQATGVIQHVTDWLLRQLRCVFHDLQIVISLYWLLTMPFRYLY